MNSLNLIKGDELPEFT